MYLKRNYKLYLALWSNTYFSSGRKTLQKESGRFTKKPVFFTTFSAITFNRSRTLHSLLRGNKSKKYIFFSFVENIFSESKVENFQNARITLFSLSDLYVNAEVHLQSYHTGNKRW